MKQRIIALIDCDSFYVSCERKDNQQLQNKPVCVMTGGGNKGIIVSRSKEAKQMGIKMGVPYFQIKDKFPDAICVPARMHRYAEISEEVMNIIKEFSPDVEVTSVDEAYIDLTGLNLALKTSYTEIIKGIRKTILEKAGIPVSIGLSSSKTLAKLASDKAKNNNGIYVIRPDKILDYIGNTTVDEICGIGQKYSQQLKFNNVFTIKEFTSKDNEWIRKVLGINGLTLKQELLGFATSLVEREPTAPQSIQDTKSFDEFTNNLEYIHYALNLHIHNACQKMRQWQGFCKEIEVILKSKEFNTYTMKQKLNNFTNSDFEIRANAQNILAMLYNPKIMYRSVGIVLNHLMYGKQIQQSLFDTMLPTDDKLSHIIDDLENKYGKGIIKVGYK